MGRAVLRGARGGYVHQWVGRGPVVCEGVPISVKVRVVPRLCCATFCSFVFSSSNVQQHPHKKVRTRLKRGGHIFVFGNTCTAVDLRRM